MMMTPDYLTTNQSEEGPWADHALILGHCKTHDSRQGWTQFWGHWLWPPLPDKAVMLSFSTLPKTLVSTFLFSTGAHRPFQQHTEEGLHIDSRQAARVSRYLWVSQGFFRPWNPQVTPGALIFLGYQLHMLWIWVFRPFSVASMPNPPGQEEIPNTQLIETKSISL